ncbi:MAG: hypothetical protein ACI4YB_13200 [Oscillospiraceae bacterium]
MYCSKCGNEIDSEALICPRCGCATANMPFRTNEAAAADEEDASLWKNAIIFAFVVPIAGLIMGIIGCIQYKNLNYKNNSVMAIVISIIVTAICAAIIVFI